ncbi:MAG TPA: PDZ domain-containing protein [Candidatus Hydrogenedentes bacterium]|nr:PDZ domain-containing protein [Candidatus Hydrogenedentota bacterium]HIJ72802.1 PDZ domain-containing protein [Candidatus Hydrogenedentota bacterium]
MNTAVLRLRKSIREGLVRKVELNRYGLLYLTLILTAVLVTVILVVKPRLEKANGWVGVVVRGHPASGTLVVEQVAPNSPAYDVGILAGDRILSYEGIAVSDINTFKMLVRDSYINELVRLIVERHGVRLVADTRIAEKPKRMTILPPIIPIAQGASPPHNDRGLCINCHTLVPPAR